MLRATALCWSMQLDRYGREQLAGLLVQRGVNAESRDYCESQDKITPLFAAVAHGHKKIAMISWNT